MASRTPRDGSSDARFRFTISALAWILFAVAFAVRLVHIGQIRPSPFFDVLLGDAHGYDAWAHRLAAGDWLGTEVFYQAPLYPYFLGVLYAAAGIGHLNQFGEPEPAEPLMRKIKIELDPQNLLNPGRLFDKS